MQLYDKVLKADRQVLLNNLRFSKIPHRTESKNYLTKLSKLVSLLEKLAALYWSIF